MAYIADDECCPDCGKRGGSCQCAFEDEYNADSLPEPTIEWEVKKI